MTIGIASALHVLSAVTWVGGMLFVLLALRPALAGLPAEVRMPFFLQVLKRFFLLVWHAVVLILISGYVLVFKLFAGFGGAPAYVHIMHALGLLMVCLFLFLFFFVYMPFRRAVKSGQSNDVPRLANKMRQIVTINLILGVVVVAVASGAKYL